MITAPSAAAAALARRETAQAASPTGPVAGDRIAVLLAEYTALKAEQSARIGARDNLVYATLTAVAAVVVGAVQADLPVLLLALPLVCVVLGWTRLANDHKVTTVGRYLGDVLAGDLAAAADGPVLGWETRHRQARGRRVRKWCQLIVDLVTFVGPAIAALAAWAVLAPSWPGAILVAAGVLLSAALAWQITLHADLDDDLDDELDDAGVDGGETCQVAGPPLDQSPETAGPA
jgi:hypothetical protein